MQEHEARSRTRGDRLGITDTPVCKWFHSQRLWSPYTSILVHGFNLLMYLFLAIVSGSGGAGDELQSACLTGAVAQSQM